jgi:hypothetical protein
VAWWWEVEELLRKLFLTALVVLMDPGSPLQVTLAVLVSVLAHVLHAMYKPWRLSDKTLDNRTYMVQHASLSVTSFVFLMGLLFKVEGVSSSSPAYESLSVVMLLLCIGFIVWWCFEMFSQVAAKACARIRRQRGDVASDAARLRSADGDDDKAASKLMSGGGGGDGQASRPNRQSGDRGGWSAVASPADVGGGDVAAHRAAVGSGVNGVDADAKASDVARRFKDTVPDTVHNHDDVVVVVRNPMHVRRGRDADRSGAGATAGVMAAGSLSDGSPAVHSSGSAAAGSDVSALSVYFQGRRAGGATAGVHGVGASRDVAAAASRAARVDTLRESGE